MSTARNTTNVPLDPYQVLGCAKTATKEELTRAYRKLALQFHPDKNKDPEAVEKFKLVNEAYSLLGDSEKRSLFDRGAVGTFMSTFGGANEPSTKKHKVPTTAEEREDAETLRKLEEAQLNYEYSQVKGHIGRLAKTLAAVIFTFFLLLITILVVPVVTGAIIFLAGRALLRPIQQFFSKSNVEGGQLLLAEYAENDSKKISHLISASLKFLLGMIFVTLFSPVIAIISIIGVMIMSGKEGDLTTGPKELYKLLVIGLNVQIKAKFHRTQNPEPTASTRNTSYHRFAEEMPSSKKRTPPPGESSKTTPATSNANAKNDATTNEYTPSTARKNRK